MGGAETACTRAPAPRETFLYGHSVARPRVRTRRTLRSRAPTYTAAMVLCRCRLPLLSGVSMLVGAALYLLLAGLGVREGGQQSRVQSRETLRLHLGLTRDEYMHEAWKKIRGERMETWFEVCLCCMHARVANCSC